MPSTTNGAKETRDTTEIQIKLSNSVINTAMGQLRGDGQWATAPGNTLSLTRVTEIVKPFDKGE